MIFLGTFLTVDKTGKTKRTSKKKEGKKVYASGTVYLMKCILDCGTTVIKIGVTGRSNIQERLMENLSAFFMLHRYIPRTTLLKFSKTNDYFRAETLLHQMYKDSSYTFPEKFQGSSEYFVIENEDKLKEDYAKIMIECKVKEKKDKSEVSEDYSLNDLDPGGAI